jgi:molybdate transport system ATP-binding protein
MNLAVDIDIRKRVSAQGRTFDLAVKFCVETPRLALYGPSGAGKTLTLQMLAGLVRPDSGRIVVNDKTWFDSHARVDLKPAQRRIGYVFQDYALFPHWTVAQNVAAAFARGWPRMLSTTHAARVERTLLQFDLNELRDSYPAQLSGGQRQRTAVARALVGRPRILLLDEPFAALDGMLRDRLRDELIALQQRNGVPLILITHDPADLDVCAHSVVSLDNGRVVDVALGPALPDTPPLAGERADDNAPEENARGESAPPIGGTRVRALRIG